MTRKFFTLLFCVIVQLACLRAQQTYHQLEIIPNQAGTAGELRLIETNGWITGTGTNYVGMKAPASIATNYVMEWPNALPGGAACLTINASGVISFDPTCAGASFPVIDTTSIVEGSVDPTKELRFEVDGFTTGTVRVLTPQNANYTIAGLETGQTFSGANIFSQDLSVIRSAAATALVESDATGSRSTFLGRAYSGASSVSGGVFDGRGIGGTKGSPSATTAGMTLLSLFAGGFKTTEVSAVARLQVTAPSLWSATNAETRWDVTTVPAGSGTAWTALSIGDAGESVTVKGRSGQTQDVFRVETSAAGQVFKILGEGSGTPGFVVAKTIVANAPGGDDLGATGNLWDDLYVERGHFGSPSSVAGSIDLYTATNSATSTIATEDVGGGFADLTVNTFLIPSTDACCGLGTSTKSWLSVSAYEYQDEFGNAGADATLTCGAGEAVKNITVSGGIVTSVSCGAP